MTREELLKHWTEHEADLLGYVEREWGKYADEAHDVVQDAIFELLNTRTYEGWHIDPGGAHPRESLIALLRQPLEFQCLRRWAKESRRAKKLKEENSPGVEVASLAKHDEEEPAGESIDIDQAPGPMTNERTELVIDVRIAIDSLNKQDRNIARMYYRLYYENGMTDQEIADKTGWTHRKVEWARTRILRLLKPRLEDYRPRKTGLDRLKSQEAS